MAKLTPEEQKTLDLYERFDEVAYGGGDLDKLDELVTEDFSHHAPFRTPQGRDGYRDFLRQFREAFPDHTSTTEDTVVEEDRIAVRYTACGTHKGEFMDIPATNNEIEIQGISIYTVDNDKISAEYAAPDLMGLMQQLGVVPEMS